MDKQMERDEDSTVKFIKPVGLPPLMVVSFGLPGEHCREFNDFYNGQFLPQLFSLSPQLRSIRRFEQYRRPVGEDSGQAQEHYFTYYELDGEDTLDKTDSIFGHAEFAKTLLEFRRLKDQYLVNFARVNYLPMQTLERPSPQAVLNPPSFSHRYVVGLELSRAAEQSFCHWYLEHYQTELFERATDIGACHTFTEYNPRDKTAPTRLIAVYEAQGEERMGLALAELERAHADVEDATWQSYCRDHALVNMGAVLQRAIFHLP
jgi:hypothetical protein